MTSFKKRNRSQLILLVCLWVCFVFCSVPAAQAACYLQQLHPVTSHIDQAGSFDSDLDDNRIKVFTGLDLAIVPTFQIPFITPVAVRHVAEMSVMFSAVSPLKHSNRAPPA